jgi:predicted phage terminase large subunit-like protein
MNLAMTREVRLYLDCKTRTDFPTFIHRTFQTIARGQPYRHNWHIDAIAWSLDQCLRGDWKRLAITLPPRHLKSICTSVAFVAWILGHDPTRNIVCASYSDNLAAKLALDCRALMESEWYRRIFPKTRISREKSAGTDFMTTARGGRFATSVGGTLTGRGGDFIIIDDPLKPDDAFSEAKRSAVNEWFDRTVSSRLNNPSTGVIVLIMQRLHPEDLIGHVMSKNLDRLWCFLNLPAIAQEEEYIRIGDNYKLHHRMPGELLDGERQPKKILDELKGQLGSFNFSAQYLQCPIPQDGELINWNWFRTYKEVPERALEDILVQSWDVASKAGEHNDFSVCTTWLLKGNQYFLLDVFRRKLVYPDLYQAVVRQMQNWIPSAILIEDQGSGTALLQELARITAPRTPPPIGIMPEGDKITRMNAPSLKIESGQVYVPEWTNWLEEFRAEVLQFPNGRYDDQIDSMSQALNWLDRRPEKDITWSF